MAFWNKKEESAERNEALEQGLAKSKRSFLDRIKHSIMGSTTIDDAVLDALEDSLIASDVGVETTLRIVERIQQRVKKDPYVGSSELNKLLAEEVCSLLPEGQGSLYDADFSGTTPQVIMVVGVNGVGKTTTVAKLAWFFKQRGKKVYLGAADTFRAAAVEQLVTWGERIGVTVIRQQQGSDPASVAYDTILSAKANNADVVLIDTAGRLHNKVNLMNELEKIKRVMQKVIPEAPHDIMLILDGSTGQNAFIQAQQFTQVTPITSLCITKLDGTAKGGVVIGISDRLNVPVRFIGIGEKKEDFQAFDKNSFVKSILDLS